MAWSLLRLFPEKMLKKINPKNLEKFYKRKDEIERLEKEKKLDAMDKWETQDAWDKYLI